jgi:dUTP pyrophosphatase
LYALEDRTIIGGEGSVLIPTGISVKLTSGAYGRIAARSGLALKHHLAVNAGVIDEDYYPGHVQVVMYGTKIGYTYTVKKGERVGGFGSTNV